ncbi:hypothetical protein E2C01_068545 [Portunus trituberculatus]|uniref:Uncharacterized protein n=1 Tax=Portunus trituberculatus TaxID=210409 RepID=A0A5B7I0D9_PORTR|nr:hypothetical protein [Portunus trituberculatus]
MTTLRKLAGTLRGFQHRQPTKIQSSGGQLFLIKVEPREPSGLAANFELWLRGGQRQRRKGKGRLAKWYERQRENVEDADEGEDDEKVGDKEKEDEVGDNEIDEGERKNITEKTWPLIMKFTLKITYWIVTKQEPFICYLKE